MRCVGSGEDPEGEEERSLGPVAAWDPQRWIPLARLEELLARTETEVGQAVAGLPGDQGLARTED